MGDHHPDLHVWNLYNNHEVRRLTLPHFQLLLHQVTQTDRLCFVLWQGSTGLFTRWWRASVAGRGSRAWAACDARPRWAASPRATTTWCRSNQVETPSANPVTQFQWVQWSKIELEPSLSLRFPPLHLLYIIWPSFLRLSCGGGTGLRGGGGGWDAEPTPPPTLLFRGKPTPSSANISPPSPTYTWLPAWSWGHVHTGFIRVVAIWMWMCSILTHLMSPSVYRTSRDIRTLWCRLVRRSVMLPYWRGGYSNIDSCWDCSLSMLTVI